jgi:hypothetical protein
VTVRNYAATAPIDDGAEFAVHRTEIGNLSFHLGQMLACDGIDPGA